MTTTPDADFRALRAAIAGDVVLPGSPDYDVARTTPIARFQGICPQAVVRCRAAADVAETLSLVRRTGARVAVRSGGHCFAGRSSTTGVVIDVGPMSFVSAADRTATVGAGARLGEIYDALSRRGHTLAAGCGPSVGIAGLTLGGGLGILGRKYGLTCDQLAGAEVVLADGRVVQCDEHHDHDLFWALRGAGGGQFGVVTTLVFRTVPAPAATTLDLTWPVTSLPALVAAWQAWAPSAPRELAASLLAATPGDPMAPATVHVFGAMLGPKADATRLLDVLIATVGADPAAAHLEYTPYRDAKRYLAEHGPGAVAAVPSQEQPARPRHAYSRSEFFRRPLPTDAIAALADHISRDRRAGQSRELDFTPWGGAYNDVPAAATAFVHRAERFLLKHEVAVDAAASPADKDEALGWLARSWNLVHPWGSGGVYPNFPDPELGDPATAYYGTNRERLMRVKAAYDPGHLFRFDQSLPGGSASS
jgi:FAD/FMN-containing dehydrogenase